VQDAGSGAGTVTLVSATSSEPDDAAGNGDGATTGDVAGWTLGTADRAGSLRAERAATGPGRTYTLTYRVSDRAGNTTDTTATVRVAQK
jgi:hypothetical protein